MSQFSSRPAFNDDPEPWQAFDIRGVDYPHRVPDEQGEAMPSARLRMGYRFAPRAEHIRPQHNPTNPILVAFRQYVVDCGGDLPWCAEIWLRAIRGRLDPGYIASQTYRKIVASPEEVAHARDVISRLAAVPPWER